jgi:hypothetical protein
VEIIIHTLQKVYRIRNKKTGMYLQHHWQCVEKKFRCEWTDVEGAHIFLGIDTVKLLAEQHGGVVERCSVHHEEDM